MRQMRLLLIEDDLNHCHEYKQCIVEQRNIHLLYIANGYRQGVEMLTRCNPDVILLDLELNSYDGDGMFFLQHLKTMELKRIPYIIIITINISDRTHALARQLGADYVFMKLKPDYSPNLIINFAYQYFLYQSKDNKIISPFANEDNIKNEISLKIEQIGITYDMNGRDYLIDAIYIAVSTGTKDLCLNKDVYPKIAKKNSKTDQCIRKAIENAIQKAWRITDFNTLTRYYTAEVSYITGTPTNKELICYFANKVKA